MSLVFTPSQLLMQEVIPVTPDLQKGKSQRSQAQQAPASPCQAGQSAGAAEHWYPPSILPQFQLRDEPTLGQGPIAPREQIQKLQEPKLESHFWI